MESGIEEALRAKAIAEKQFVEKDFVGAKNYALKAQKLCPELDGIAPMVATFGVYFASVVKVNGELDFYSILGADPSTDKPKLKKQYKKMAVLLHPDQNKTVGADGAFRLVSEAWTILSDSVKRRSYDQRRSLLVGYGAGAGGYDDCSKVPDSHSKLDSFWTVCTSCHVQYEYLRKYVNKRLTCKNCRGVFIATETGLAPANGSFPYSTCSYAPENGYGTLGCAVTYVPPTTGCWATNGVSGYYTGLRSEYISNLSFQSNLSPNSVSVLDPNGLSTPSFVIYQTNAEAIKIKANGKHHATKAAGHMSLNGYPGYNESLRLKRGRSVKKLKLDQGSMCTSEQEEVCSNIAVVATAVNGNGILKPTSKLSSPSGASARHCAATPAFDARQFLIEKARSEIRRKLEEMRLASEVEAVDTMKRAKVDKSIEVSVSAGAGLQPEQKRTVSMSITVPDSDFHNFDLDRSEEFFKPKQIWALYEEEDGMPRLYCLIREVISLNPFKLYISYLSLKSDSEFGSVKLDSGFTKSCGSFRVYYSEMVEQVNIFSHLLSREKAGRGGCVRIYPRGGDIWAVYQSWSPDCNRTTPHQVRHQYEMVEVLEDYSEEHGVWVNPLCKLEGFKTVYQRNTSSNAIRWISRSEMLQFSHRVPSCSLEGTNLPEGCWDLDPAAIPKELLQAETELHNNASPHQTGKNTEIPKELYKSEPNVQSAGQCDNFASNLDKGPQFATNHTKLSQTGMSARN